MDGVVVGSAQFPGATRDAPFRWEDGQMTELPVPAGTVYDAGANDINDKGVIVGFYEYDINPQDSYHNSAPKGLRWEPGGALTELPCCFAGVDPPAYGLFGSAAEGINELGVISGTAWSGKDSNPFTWDGAFTPLAPAGEEETGAFGQEINESGVVVGSINIAPSDRGAVYEDGTRTIIAIQPGNNGLNDLGHVVGERASESGKKQIAQLWDGKTYTTLGVEGVPSMADAINNSGWIVGRSGVESYQPGGGTAYLWRPGAPMATLNSLVGGWNLEAATDINENGVIVGRGFHGTEEMGFIMTPSGLAYQLTGKVTDPAGAPAAGVAIRVLRASDGQPAGDAVRTDADGRYSWTLPRGSYRVTAMPEGDYAVVFTPDCTIVAVHCDIAVTRNRVVDFQAVAPGKPDSPPPTTTTARDATGPAFKLPASAGKLKVTKGAAAFKLAAFAEPVTGTITLKAGKQTLGKARFALAAGKAAKVKVKLTRAARKRLRRKRKLKAAATVKALDAAGNATTRTAKVTLLSR